MSAPTEPKTKSRAVAKRRATFADLAKKKRREAVFSVMLPGDSGEPEELEMVFQAISPKEYDKLVSDNPPSKEQQRQGAAFNLDTFGPALLSACSMDPKLSVEEAADLWTNPDWSAGEIGSLYAQAYDLCNQGLNVPFTARG